MAKPYFTRRRRISLKKAIRFCEWLFSCDIADKRCPNRGKNEEKVNFDDYDSPFYRHTVYCNHLVL